MNLRLCNGMVPIYTGDPTSPYKLVPFPSREVFNTFYKNKANTPFVDRNWDLLQDRVRGASLEACALKSNLTRERIRQIEARFLRKMRQYMSSSAIGSL